MLKNETVEAYRHQDYDEIKSNLLKTNKLFEDPLFPATNESIFQKKSVPKGLIWKRPSVLKIQFNFIYLYIIYT